MRGASASGPDGVPAQLIKDYAEHLVKPMMTIWRKSLDSGILPEGTALALITLIDKGDEHSLPSNYRPVSLTNHLTKIHPLGYF